MSSIQKPYWTHFSLTLVWIGLVWPCLSGLVMVFFYSGLVWSDLWGVVRPTPTTLWKHFEHFAWLRKHFGHFVWLFAVPFLILILMTTLILIMIIVVLTSISRPGSTSQASWSDVWCYIKPGSIHLSITESITKYNEKYYKILQSIDNYCKLLRSIAK